MVVLGRGKISILWANTTTRNDSLSPKVFYQKTANLTGVLPRFRSKFFYGARLDVGAFLADARFSDRQNPGVRKERPYVPDRKPDWF